MNKTAASPQKEHITSKLSVSLSKLERRHKLFMNMALEEYGVSGIPYRFFVAVMKNPGASQDFLAEHLGVDKSHVARIVRKMELAGYVERVLVPENRRQYKLTLTSAGKGVYKIISETNDEWEALITGDIDGGDLKATLATLGKIIKNVDGINK